MPKLKKERATSKLHTSASAKPTHSAANSGGWAISASKKKKKHGASSSDEIAVEAEDLLGLDVESAANESESSKRAAMADALKELIAMGDDDDEEDDSDDDAAAAFGGMGDSDGDDTKMDARQPTRGSLQVKAKKAIAVAKMAPAQPAASAAVSFTAAPVKLTFAPSAPQRNSAAALVASARAAVAAAAASDAPADASAPVVPAKIQATKLDKRALKHDRLMSRLALPGTASAMAKRSAAGSSFQNLRQLGTELNTSVLTPTQQNAIALLQQKQAAQAAVGASDKRDVLFLNDEGDKERLKQLQKQINQVKQQKAVAVPRAAVGAQAAVSAASAPAPAPAPVVAPSPFIPQKNLTKSGRARQHANELAQFTAVLHHPQFQQSPLQSLHLHLQNSATLQKLQQEAAGINVMEATQPKKQQSGSQKKKNKAAAARRAQIMQQANEMS